MPTGSARRQRGFTYLGLLLVLALQGAALAALGRSVSTAVQRDKEAELVFRGEQIRAAIGRYRAAGPAREYPRRLEDLLVDERGTPPLHHLRRLYADPFTGRPDWVPMPDASGQGVAGVHSRSAQSALRRMPRLNPEGGARVGDWQFLHDPAAAPGPEDPDVAGVPEGTRQRPHEPEGEP